MTHNHHWTIKGLLLFGWDKAKEHFIFTLGLIGIALVLGALTGWIWGVSTIVETLEGIAVVSIFLDMVNGHTPHYRDLLKPFRNYKITWHYVLASLILLAVFGVIATIGSLLILTKIEAIQIIAGILLIIIFIYLAIRVQFFRYFIVENESMGPVVAIKKSLAITKNHFWKLFGFLLALAVLNLLGLIALVIGLIFTIPVTIFAYTKLYKELTSDSHTTHETHHIAYAD